MKPITLRGLDDDTARTLRDLAEREGLSLNKAALRMLKSASASPSGTGKRIGNALDRHFGTWTRKEKREFDRAVAWFSPIAQFSPDVARGRSARFS